MPAAPTRSAATLTDDDGQRLTALREGSIRALSRTITLIESTRADHRARAGQVLDALLPDTGRSMRIGISGVPGVGKSTFIETLGLHLVGAGHRVAVLAVDPSSSRSGGSILGDKTRMEQLSRHPAAFIRPSPTSGSLGGVASRTRESMLACEAAGFDVIIVETVGVGQSEVAVAGMVDCFVLLQLPNAGDELQGIKRGIMELADLVVINKADLNPTAARLARRQIAGALHLLSTRLNCWRPEALSLSARDGSDIEKFWARVEDFFIQARASGELERCRSEQAVEWLWMLLREGLEERFRTHPKVRDRLPALLDAVGGGDTTTTHAAQELLDRFSPRG